MKKPVWFDSDGFSYFLMQNYQVIILAIKNAALAASAPMAVILVAPQIGGCPVSIALRYPKINKQQTVTMAEYLRPVTGLSVRK